MFLIVCNGSFLRKTILIIYYFSGFVNKKALLYKSNKSLRNKQGIRTTEANSASNVE